MGVCLFVVVVSLHIAISLMFRVRWLLHQTSKQIGSTGALVHPEMLQVNFKVRSKEDTTAGPCFRQPTALGNNPCQQPCSL